MKIAIPTNNQPAPDAVIAEHFGRCNFYSIFNQQGELIEVIKNNGQHMGGSLNPPQILKKHKIDILICKNLGPKAIDLCDQLKIKVYLCTENNTKTCLNLFINNKLDKASQKFACQDHKHNI